MALKARVTAAELAALPEAIRKEYTDAGDGAHMLSVTAVDGYDLQDINGLKSALQKKTTELNTAKSTLKAFEVDGEVLDPKVALKAIEDVKKFATLDPKKLADEQVATALKQQQEQHNKLLGTESAKAEKLKTQLRAVLIDQAATAVLASKGGNVKLLLPHVRGKLDMVEDGENFKVRVIDEAGHTRIHVAKGQTADMNIEQLIDEMAASTDFATAFKAPGSPGGGTQGGGAPGGGNAPGTVSKSQFATGQVSLEDVAAGKVRVA